MHIEATKTIILSFDALLGIFGTILSILFSAVFFLARYLIREIAAMRAQIVSTARECAEKSAKHIDDMDDRIDELNACREDSTRHIVALEHDLQAVIKICQERHGR